MLGSTIINRRQHVGLQKLSALAELARSSLGPNKRYKFIRDDETGESALACSCVRILENLELTCLVGQLVYETVETHHSVYRTGSRCLLFLAGAWSRAALECLRRGIPVAHIVSAMSEGVELCLDVCRQCSISIERCDVSGLDLWNKPTVKGSRLSAPQQLAPRTRESVGRTKKLKLSRHFCEQESPSISDISACSSDRLFPNVTHIARTLSHGCTHAMNLVIKVSQMQSECDRRDVAFDVTKVVTCVLPGLVEERATVVPGCVVLVAAEKASVAHHLEDKRLKVALVHGDLSAAYRHLGFNRPKGMQRVRDRLDSSRSSEEDTWTEKVARLLLNLEVNAVLVSGVASENITECCRRRGVLVVEKVKASVLKAFAISTGAVPVTYATQLNRRCIGCGLKVSTWRDLSNYHDRKCGTALNITADGPRCGLVTVILTSSVHGKLQTLEDQFWACAYRLHWALKDQALLPGAGVSEMACVQHLRKQRDRDGRNPTEIGANSVQRDPRTPAHPYRDAVWTLMADGFMDYIDAVMVNAGAGSKVGARAAATQHLQDCHGTVGDTAAKFSQLFVNGDSYDNGTPTSLKSSEDPNPSLHLDPDPDPDPDPNAPATATCDNVLVKQVVWRNALDLVLLVLQTDAEVITGVDQQTDGAQEDLMFF